MTWQEWKGTRISCTTTAARWHSHHTHISENEYHSKNAWWRHQMETFSALLALCAGIHWSPVSSPHKGQWHGALMFSLICAWTNGWVNNREAGDLRRHRAHYDIIVMEINWIRHQQYKERLNRHHNNTNYVELSESGLSKSALIQGRQEPWQLPINSPLTHCGLVLGPHW